MKTKITALLDAHGIEATFAPGSISANILALFESEIGETQKLLATANEELKWRRGVAEIQKSPDTTPLPCGHAARGAREREVGMCWSCELAYHGCSTGDCPHERQEQCDAELRALKAQQKCLCLPLPEPPHDDCPKHGLESEKESPNGG